MSSIPGGLITQGSIPGLMLQTNANIKSSQMEIDSLNSFPVDLSTGRIWDAMHTNLPTTGETDNLGFSGGTFATDAPHLTAGDLGAAGATTRYARYSIPVPHSFVIGQTITLRVVAGMLTAIADVSCFVDVEVYVSDEDTTIVAGDVNATAQQDCNSLTFSNLDFELTANTVPVAGDVLDVRLAIICNDAAEPVVEPAIALVTLLCDTRP